MSDQREEAGAQFGGRDPKQHTVTFRPSGRGKAQCEPNPDYPSGIALDVTTPGLPSCKVDLPYPAPECGAWMVLCNKCSIVVGVTAAGRPDDPISVAIQCLTTRAGGTTE